MGDALASKGRAVTDLHHPGSEDHGQRDTRLRRAVLAVDPGELRSVLAGAPRPVQESLARAARTPVPVLLRLRSTRALSRIQDPLLVSTLAALVSDQCLEAVRAHLGDHADDPDRPELLAALEVALEVPFTPETITVMLALVASGGGAAADVCDELLDADPRFNINDPAPVDPPASTNPSDSRRRTGPGAAQREARRARKAEEAERRRRERARAAAAAERTRAAQKEAHTRVAPPAPEGPEPVDVDHDGAGHGHASDLEMRRLPQLSESDARRFDVDGPLVGSIVIAEVRFDAEDPSHPDLVSKWRPVVVIGESRTHLLVRAGYSVGGFKTRTWKSYELRDWADAGLHERTWIEAKPHRIPRRKTADRVGRLSARDWNSLW